MAGRMRPRKKNLRNVSGESSLYLEVGCVWLVFISFVAFVVVVFTSFVCFHNVDVNRYPVFRDSATDSYLSIGLDGMVL